MTARETITANIKTLIQCSGLKQKAVAERSGFGEKEFSHMMNGRKEIKAEYIPAIASALGVTPNEIYGQKGV